MNKKTKCYHKNQKGEYIQDRKKKKNITQILKLGNRKTITRVHTPAKEYVMKAPKYSNVQK